MEPHEVIPDVIDWFDPTVDLKVKYEDKEVHDATKLRPSEVHHRPTVHWSASAHDHYALVMTDPDAPSKAKPTSKEWRHWVVANIPGDRIDQGETLSAYAPSAPPSGSGYHRYVFLLFKQPGKLHFERMHDEGRGRAGWCARKWAQENHLTPVGGTFFFAKNEHDS